VLASSTRRAHNIWSVAGSVSFAPHILLLLRATFNPSARDVLSASRGTHFRPPAPTGAPNTECRRGGTRAYACGADRDRGSGISVRPPKGQGQDAAPEGGTLLSVTRATELSHAKPAAQRGEQAAHQRGPPAMTAGRATGEWEVRGDARAETRCRFRTVIASVVPSVAVSDTGSPPGVVPPAACREPRPVNEDQRGSGRSLCRFRHCSFGNCGFAGSAPEWPRKRGDVEELRETAEGSAGLGVREIVDHYEQLIRDLDQPPVLIGHSYGGLFVELLDRGLGRAGVAMSPAPPKGILALPFSTLKSAAPAPAHPSKWHGVVTLTPEEFTYAFVNTFFDEDAAAAYEHYAVAETGQIFYEGGFANFHLHPPTDVHFSNEDRPAAAARRRDPRPHRARVADQAQYERYERSPAKTDYPEFEGRPHPHSRFTRPFLQWAVLDSKQ
jgi:pimeloyl-ACP methyl ester carboxylesterase